MYFLSDALSASRLRIFAYLLLALFVLATLLFIFMRLHGIPGPPLAPTAVEYAV